MVVGTKPPEGLRPSALEDKDEAGRLAGAAAGDEGPLRLLTLREGPRGIDERVGIPDDRGDLRSGKRDATGPFSHSSAWDPTGV